ncbi:hypothetical protein [Lysinibacter sp. HNR]|uniref:hypothetical protein n=1 Tax=Lysinibacter sp. HNR TaxID=3031408 RepID=UPI00243541E3|nr:hypothetical protein [Lysinibacter sp. HNR]WGD36897.1 hypothetical protein FrondiHNR_10645 [Lysinibacter sp. HNR]
MNFISNRLGKISRVLGGTLAFVLVGSAMTFAAPAAAQADDSSPATLRWENWGHDRSVGLDTGGLSASIRNTSSETITDAYIRYDISNNGSNFLLQTVLGGNCTQPDGRGGHVICGPLTVNPGSVVRSPQFVMGIPADYYRLFDTNTVTLTASLVGGNIDLSGVAAPSVDMFMYTYGSMQTTIRYASQQVTSLGSTILTYRVSQAGPADFPGTVADILIPPELIVRGMPSSCRLDGPADASGQKVQCTYDSRRQTISNIGIHVGVVGGLETGYRIDLPEPVVTYTNPIEPADAQKNVWEAEVVFAPFWLDVVGSDTGPLVDLAIEINDPDPAAADPSGVFNRDETVTFPTEVSLLSATDFASNVRTSYTVNGPVQSLTTDIPGCVVEGLTVNCYANNLFTDETLSGSITATLDDRDERSLVTIEGIVGSTETDTDLSNNQASNSARVAQLQMTDLYTSITGPTEAVEPGTPVDLELGVRNEGDDAEGVVATFNLDAGAVEMVLDHPLCTVNDLELACVIGELSAGETWATDIMVSTKTLPEDDELLEARATVDSITPDRLPDLRGSNYSLGFVVALPPIADPGPSIDPDNSGVPLSRPQSELSRTGSQTLPFVLLTLALLAAGTLLLARRRVTSGARQELESGEAL